MIADAKLVVEVERRPARKGESKLTEAADKATALLQDLQSRLSKEAPKVSHPEPMDDLERELQEYFREPAMHAAAPQRSVLNEMRERVIEGIVERLLENWEQPRDGHSTAMEDEVVERLIARVMERLGGSGTNARQLASGRARR